MHAKHNSLSEATRSLSQGPCLTFSVDQQGPTQKPDLMFTRRTYNSPGTEHYKQYTCSLSSPLGKNPRHTPLETCFRFSDRPVAPGVVRAHLQQKRSEHWPG